MRRSDVLRRIRSRQRKRLPQNVAAVHRDDPRLVEAVYAVEPFWGWHDALADAGLSYDDIRIEVRQSVRCEECGKPYRALSAHLKSVHGMDADDYRDAHPNADLFSEELRSRMMGPTATPHPDRLPHWEPFYTDWYVLDRAHRYASEGHWMELSNMQIIDASLAAAAGHYLDESGWDNLLRRIGLDPAEFRGCRKDDDFTTDDFAKWLKRRRDEGLSCTKDHLFGDLDDYGRREPIVVWAVRRHGNWTAALKAAGVDFADPIFGGRRHFTADELLDQLKRLPTTLPDMSRISVVLTTEGLHLAYAAEKHFGSWDAALDAAGIEPSQRTRTDPYRTKSDVKKGITARLRNGFSVTPLEMTHGTRRDNQLFKAAFRHFASWRAAVVASGATAGQIRQASQTPFGTRAKVREELRRRSRNVESLSVAELSKTDDGKQLRLMASGFYGDWQSAVRDAGVDPRDYHQKNVQPTGRYKTDEEVLAAIRNRSETGQPLNARALTHGDHADVPLLYTARRRFGGWASAVAAAGIDYDTVARKKQDYTAQGQRTYASYPTDKQILAAIRRRRREGLPLNARGVTHHPDHGKRDFPLHRRAIAEYGSWEKALQAAGIDPETTRPAWVTKRAKKRRRSQSS